MNNLELTKQSLQALTPILAEHGFKKKSEATFVRKQARVIERLQFPSRTHAVSGRRLMSLLVGMRFEDLEALLKRDDAEKDAMTFVVPSHFLREDRSFNEWALDEPDTLLLITQELQLRVMPFLEKYRSLDAVLVSLESTDSRDEFALTPDSKAILHAGILMLRGSKDVALRILDAEIETLKSKPALRSAELRKVRDRIAEITTA